MAGFLRRKNKNSDAKQQQNPPISTPSAPSARVETPLFARFATTSTLASSGGGSGEYGAGTRVVSSPMQMSGGVRRETSTRNGYAAGSGHGSSSVSVASSGRGQQRPPPTAFYNDERPSYSRQSLDNAPTSPRGVVPVGRGPPPVKVQQPLRPRTSLNIPDDKPLPVPGEQAQYRPPPVSGRKLSLQTSSTSSQARPTYTTNLLDDEFGDLTPQVTTPRASLYRSDPPPPLPPGAARLSTNGEDIPPEFALYQQITGLSASPPDPAGPRSVLAPPPPQNKSPFTATPPPPRSSASPPLPPPPTQGNMGNSNSVLASSLYHTAPLSSKTSPPSNGHGPAYLTADVKPTAKTTTPARRVGYATPSPPPPPGASPPVIPIPSSYAAPPPPTRSSPSIRSTSKPQQQQASGIPVPVRRAPSVVSIPKGPRIFAAMAAAEPEPESHYGQGQQAYYDNQGPSAYPTPESQSSHQLPSPPPSTSSNYNNNGISATNGYAHQDSRYGFQQPSTSTSTNQGYSNHEFEPAPDAMRTPRISNARVLAPVPPPPPPHNPSSSPSSSAISSSPSKSIHGRSASISSRPQQLQVQANPTPPQSPARGRKLSKARHGGSAQQQDVGVTVFPNGSTTSIVSGESVHSTQIAGIPIPGQNGLQRVLTKSNASSIAPPPPLPGTPLSPNSIQGQGQVEEPPKQVDEETMRNAGIPLDDDPFAKVEGVRMLSPIAPGDMGGAEPVPLALAVGGGVGGEGSIRRRKGSKGDTALEGAPEGGAVVAAGEAPVTAAGPSTDAIAPTPTEQPPTKKEKKKKETPEEKEERRRERRERRAREKAELKEREKLAALAAAAGAVSPTTHDEPEPEPLLDSELEAMNLNGGRVDDTTFPLNRFVSHPQLLANLLSYFSFYDWCVLLSVTKEVRMTLVQTPALREEVLERFLRTVGYARWGWEGEREPLSLSLQDLSDYMHGVSTPSHEYARVAKMYVHSLKVNPHLRDASLEQTVRSLNASARAYTRVVLRLRAQAEKEAAVAASSIPAVATHSTGGGRSGSVPPPSAAARNGSTFNNGYVNGFVPSRPASRATSRAPSPTMSTFSHSHSNGHHAFGNGSSPTPNGPSSQGGFRSPLFRLRRAPLLRVFVPSPEGDWLSDRSVLECEAECKRAGVLGLMRMGDVVWDIAVGDEGNVGRLVYDGKYLIDLDYTFNPIGDLPKYIPALAFPPSYFHRVIRTGAVTSNPVVHMDIAPWGEEVAANLQLLQDRVKTETPQGAYHNVVRWVHRSSFVIRPPPRVMQRGPSVNGRPLPPSQPHTPRIPIPDTDNLFIDPGWYGTIVVETEGTNEALADLQERCGPRAFPPRPRSVSPAQAKALGEVRRVFRILREKSRPGEIWIKAVGVKERIL